MKHVPVLGIIPVLKKKPYFFTHLIYIYIYIYIYISVDSKSSMLLGPIYLTSFTIWI